jgi:hypothetical protein
MTTIQDLMKPTWGSEGKIMKQDPKVNLENRFMLELDRVEGMITDQWTDHFISEDKVEVSMISFIVKVILGKAYADQNTMSFKDLNKAIRDMIKMIGQDFHFYICMDDMSDPKITMQPVKNWKKISIPSFMTSEKCFTIFDETIIMNKAKWEDDTPYFNEDLDQKLTLDIEINTDLKLCTICDLEVRKKIKQTSRVPYWDLNEYFCSKHREYIKLFRVQMFNQRKMKNLTERAKVTKELAVKTDEMFGLGSLDTLVMSDLSSDVFENMAEKDYFLLELAVMSLAHFRRMFCMDPNLVSLSKKVYDMSLFEWHKQMKVAMNFWIRTYYFSKKNKFDWEIASDMLEEFDFDWDQSEALEWDSLNNLFYEFKRRVIYRIKLEVEMASEGKFRVDDNKNTAEAYMDTILRKKASIFKEVDPEELEEAEFTIKHNHLEWDYDSVMEANGMQALVYSNDI